MLTMDEFGAMMDTLALQPKEEEAEPSNAALALELTPQIFLHSCVTCTIALEPRITLSRASAPRRRTAAC